MRQRGGMPRRLDAYRTLADSPAGTPLDELICGHLHLVREDFSEAALSFAAGSAQLQGDGPSTRVEQLFAKVQRHLNAGEFVAATASIRKLRSLVEILLAAEAGLMLAASQAGGMGPLVRLSDVTLRLLARVELAVNLSGALRERHLDHDAALWATTPAHVQALLQREAERLLEVVNRQPAHAEMAYRLGLLKLELTGNLESAACATDGVLRIHRPHVPAAVRWAVTQMELQRPPGDAVRDAFLVPSETLWIYSEFATAAICREVPPISIALRPSHTAACPQRASESGGAGPLGTGPA